MCVAVYALIGCALSHTEVCVSAQYDSKQNAYDKMVKKRMGKKPTHTKIGADGVIKMTE